jgi:hypothetical protein
VFDHEVERFSFLRVHVPSFAWPFGPAGARHRDQSELGRQSFHRVAPLPEITPLPPEAPKRPRMPDFCAHPEGTMPSKRLTTQQRKEIFLNLVETQDAINNVRQSYEVVTEKYDISEDQLRQIEEEGLDNEWPPLCEATPNSL